MLRVALVTGANKGIGFEIVKGLLKSWDGLVYLTARDEKRGLAALDSLRELKNGARFHVLDVSKEDSVRALAAHLKTEHGGLDLLVHNAGVAYHGDTTIEQDENTIAINYGSLALLERHFYPLLRKDGRVLNISSDCGHLSNVRDQYWIQTLASPNLTIKDVDSFVSWYLQRRREGKWTGQELADGGTVAAYRVAKVAMSARTRLQAAALRERGVCVNSMHPGLVRTEMTRGIGFLTAAEAARTPLWLLLEAPDNLTGAYLWYDGKKLDWADHTADYYFKFATLKYEPTS